MLGVNDDSYQIGATDRRRSSNMMMTRPNENISLGKHVSLLLIKYTESPFFVSMHCGRMTILPFVDFFSWLVLHQRRLPHSQWVATLLNRMNQLTRQKRPAGRLVGSDPYTVIGNENRIWILLELEIKKKS